MRAFGPCVRSDSSWKGKIYFSSLMLSFLYQLVPDNAYATQRKKIK